MSSRISQIYLKCLEIVDAFRDGTKNKFKYTNIFDDQIYELIEGDSYSFSTPSIFFKLEKGEGKALGNKVTSYPDAQMHIYIVNQILNSNNMEQNLPIFELRDIVKNSFINANIPFCSSFMCVGDDEDFKHGSVYVYKLSFKTNFIDTVGSIVDIVYGGIRGIITNFNLYLNYRLVSVNELNVDLQGYDVTYVINENSNTFVDDIQSGVIIRDVIYLNNGVINGWAEQGITRIGNTWDFTSIGGLLKDTVFTIIYGIEI